jgi:hypothetical protein
MVRVTAREAAQLVGVSDKTMLAWLANGKDGTQLTAEQAKKRRTKGPAAWSIDTDALETLPGVHMDLERLAELQAERSHAPGGLRSRVDSLECQVRDLQREIARIRVLAITQGMSLQEPDLPPVTRYDEHEILEELVPMLSNLAVSVATHLPTGASSPGDQILGPFAKAHGVPPRTAQDHAEKDRQHRMGERRQTPNRPSESPFWVTIEQQRYALEYWRANWSSPHEGRIVHACDDPLCVCHDVVTR